MALPVSGAKLLRLLNGEQQQQQQQQAEQEEEDEGEDLDSLDPGSLGPFPSLACGTDLA